MVVLAAHVWHYWIAVALLVPAILLVIGAALCTSRRSSPRVPEEADLRWHAAVDWELAERVAVRVAGREPFSESYHYDSLEPDFEELTAQAEELVDRRAPACARWRAPPAPG